MKNQGNMWVLVLIVVLAISIIYIGFDTYKDYSQKKDAEIFQSGATYGFQQAIISVASQASTCQQVPLVVNNQTVNIVAVDCLKAAN